MRTVSRIALTLAVLAALPLSGCGRPPYTTEEGSLRNQALQVVEAGSGSESILLVPVHGLITADEGDAPVAINTLRQLRTEGQPKGIKVVLLHVDSPGGDVTTSDVLAEEVRRCQAKGIKVVAFFGDTAASGGYYVSAGADRIVARPTSICGSIGVIMMHFDAQKLLVDRLGIQEDSIVSGEYKNVPSFFRPLKPEERKYLQGIIDSLYGRFVKTVADGRKLKEADVRKLADGRVYTAEEAMKLGLVDRIGQRDEAIAEARKLAGDENATVISYRRVPSFFETLLHGEAESSPIPREVRTLAKLALQTKMLYLWRP